MWYGAAGVESPARVTRAVHGCVYGAAARTLWGWVLGFVPFCRLPFCPSRRFFWPCPLSALSQTLLLSLFFWPSRHKPWEHVRCGARFLASLGNLRTSEEALLKSVNLGRNIIPWQTEFPMKKQIKGFMEAFIKVIYKCFYYLACFLSFFLRSSIWVQYV